MSNIRGVTKPQINEKLSTMENRIYQQASRISRQDAQNQKLTQLLEPKFVDNTTTQAVASNLNINGATNPVTHLMT